MKYKATIKIMGRSYTSTGESVIACLNSLKPGFCKTKSVLIIEKGDQKIEKILGVIPTSRLFSSAPSIREVQTKQTATLFNL